MSEKVVTPIELKLKGPNPKTTKLDFPLSHAEIMETIEGQLGEVY